MLKQLYYLLIIFAFLSCKKAEKKEKSEPYKGPLLELENVDGRFSDSARLKFKFSSPFQIKHQNENEEYPKGIHVESYNDKEEQLSKIDAKYTMHYGKEKYWHLKDSVVVVNLEKQQTLETEEIFWKPDSGQIWSEVKVKITTPDQILTGVGLTAKDDFSEYEILKPESIIFVDTDEE